MTTIYFVRHAHSHYTPDEYNRPLSEQGWIKAQKLVNVFEGIDIQAIYASCYQRAVETVQPIAASKKLAITQEKALNERILAKSSVPDFASAIAKVWAEPTFFFDGGESNIMAQQRVVPVLEELLMRHQNEKIIIGIHGNILTLLLQHFNPKYDIDFWQSLKMPDIVVAKFKNKQLLSTTRLIK
ncbi:histidine phosphatase family protein [Lysinibacillus louembei]|uniref:Histidine phosphatase family protein n=1 Tax=Lysinibacillus louembei TaxID=1470088 RepID=A0ABZ0RTB6_9BACI|nr:histidine phosphatase family protein [Lysinibacillus louembei]WPK11385.1 histidine phosphatase family protein [Lysinibacillus louembei]